MSFRVPKQPKSAGLHSGNPTGLEAELIRYPPLGSLTHHAVILPHMTFVLLLRVPLSAVAAVSKRSGNMKSNLAIFKLS